MAKPNPDCLRRASHYYLLGKIGDDSSSVERCADMNIYMSRGSQFVPALVRDYVREERATRHWFAHRRGGWTPTDIVLRSPLHETETWYDPRGQQ